MTYETDRDINKENVDERAERVKLNQEAYLLKTILEVFDTKDSLELTNLMQDINDTVKRMNKNYNNIAGRDVF